MTARVVAAALFALALGLGVSALAVPREAPRCDVSGTWRGDGADVDRTQWRFSLVLAQHGTSVTGAFDWTGNNGDDGRERVAGSVDCAARVLRLHGVAIEHGHNIAVARYAITLDEAFATFSGSWTGGVPGTLSGAR